VNVMLAARRRCPRARLTRPGRARMPVTRAARLLTAGRRGFSELGDE
jgi:hypothetical protein